jgi:antitoxin PrlF
MEDNTSMARSRRSADRAIAISKLTTKGQITVPLCVRQRLALEAGDSVIFEESEAVAVRIRKAEALDLEFIAALSKTLPEWNSGNDDEAYRNL